MNSDANGRSAIRTKSVLWLGLVAALGLVLGGAIAVSRQPSQLLDAERSYDLGRALEASDAVVVVDRLDETRVVAHETGAEYQVFDANVVEVIVQSHRWNQESEVLAPPAIIAGPIELYQPLGRSGDVQLVSDFAATDTQVLVLGYWEPDIYSDWPAAWSIIDAANVDTAHALEFIGNGAEAHQANLEHLRTVVETDSDLATLAVWAQEGYDRRIDPTVDAPLTAAHDATRPGRTDRDAIWLAQPNIRRGLDPELTPRAVMDTLAEIPVFMAVEGPNDGYLAVVTATGVAHSARLDGGSHVATYWVAPGESWDIYIEPDVTPTTGSTPVASIAAADWASGDALLLEITSNGTGVGVRHQSMTIEAFNAYVADWAESIATDQP